MRFVYSPAVTLAPDEGEPVVMMRPEVPIHLRGADGTFHDFTALGDTGADHILFPQWVIDDVGIATTDGTGPPSLAYSGAGIPLSHADLEIQSSSVLKHTVR